MRMKPNERKRALLAIRENIEMELFSSEESCEARSTQELQEDACFYQNLEHPLVCICEEEPTLDVPGHQDRPQKTKPDTVTPVRENITGESRPLPPVFMEDIEIEMEVLPHHTKSEAQRVGLITPTFHAASSNKASRMKWKRVTPQMTGLVVKDVLCLPRGHYNTESARNGAPQGKERAALSAMGLSARITIDRQWSAKQMESRLAVLFRGRVAKRAGQRFSFSYLQCMQGVLLLPVAPAEGWTAARVLRIAGPGALYIFCHHEHMQASSETLGVDRGELRLERCQDGDHPQDRRNPPHAPVDSAPGGKEVETS
ncbi:uncharacterized protein LOC109525411 isoform X3 [Hippocampus comes]|uniref:uncharacterized protein LOC109525411 isoform X3 n=1 Tax=Hippocampus comes TaxID=109280 RepID=UPI00094EA6F5|nr:PREDICTED: uncharacterized protein LOC109525411 isoform X3 [Hippocampus comes]